MTVYILSYNAHKGLFTDKTGGIDRPSLRVRVYLIFSLSLFACAVLVMCLLWKRHAALSALRASGIVLGRRIPLSQPYLEDYVDEYLDPGLISSIELSGWLPGGHVVQITGPLPRHVSQEASDALLYLQNADSLLLWNANLTDSDIKKLAGVRTITSLNISDNPITDDSLPWLLELPLLKALYVGGTNITPEGMERFRQKRPSCTVVGDDQSMTPRSGR